MNGGNDKAQKWVKILFIIAALLLFGYTVSRAYLLSFTFDESYSYTSYVKDTYSNIFLYRFLTSNSHVLNSLLMKLSTEFFAPSDFTLRLHSLLGHGLFIVFSWLILKDIKNPWMRLGAFLLTNTNPFVLDFFSLARGYGLALGLMIASLFYFKRYLQHSGFAWLSLVDSIVFAGLSTMANFTMLNYMLALMGVILLYAFYQQFRNSERKFLWKSLVAVTLTAAPFLFYILTMVFRLRDAKELYYGGRKGFWIDTVSTLIDSTLYLAHYMVNARLLMQIAIILIMALGLFFMVYKFMIRRTDPDPYKFFLALCSIFVAIIAGTELQHLLLNTYYLVDRTALLFIPLFYLCTGYLFYYLTALYKPARFLFGALVLAALLQSAYVLNFTKTETWPEQADIKTMMKDLNQVRLQKDPLKTDYFLSPFWTCAPAADFYREVNHYTWLKKVEVRPPTLKENFFFFPDSELNLLGKTPVKILKKYPVTGYDLLENLAPAKREVFAEGSLAIEPGEKGCEGAVFSALHSKDGPNSAFVKPGNFSPGLNFEVGKMLGDSLYRVEASAWIYFDSVNNRDGELVISVKDSNGIYKWTSQNFQRYFDMQGHWMHVYFGDWMPKVRTRQDVVNVSVYNKSKRIPFYVDDIEAKVFR